MYDLYNDDLLLNPRKTESSATVLTVWKRRDDAYAPIFPAKGITSEEARHFFNITAERVFFRRKILGIHNAEADFVGKRIIRNAHPFGDAGPTLLELLDAGVTAVMTYVPLASAQSGGGSVLARLYCVEGLAKKYSVPFDCSDLARRCELNLFLSGMDSEVRPCGTSWQLAAQVMSFAIRERHASVDIRERLASDYVFTGAVGEDSRILPVEKIPEKVALARIPEYMKLKWGLPRDNCAEGENIRVIPVTTLDDAYEYVTGHGPDTNLFDLVKDGVDGKYLRTIYKLLRSGADANAAQSGGRNVRQMIMANIQRKIIGLIRSEGLKDRPVIEIQNEIRRVLAPEWDAEKASSYYGNDPLLFFLAARSGDESLLQALHLKMDINAVDRDGETALDFAIEAGDKEVKKRLERTGAKHRGIYALNSKRVRAFLRDPDTEFGVDDGKFILEAIDEGLDPLAETDFGLDENGAPVERKRELWDNDKAAKDPWDKSPMSEYTYSKTSVLREAILIKKRVLVEKCLESLKQKSHVVPKEYLDLANQYSSPLIIRALRESGIIKV